MRAKTICGALVLSLLVPLTVSAQATGSVAGTVTSADGQPVPSVQVSIRGTALGALTTSLGLPGVALTLEGGYDLAALRRSVAASVRGLLEGMRA